MIIALGSDHRGTEVRDHVRDVLEQSGHEVRLFTAPDGDGKSCDYPDVAHPVGRSVDRLVTTWLETEFEGGRHARRVDKITAIEQGKNPAQLTDNKTD